MRWTGRRPRDYGRPGLEVRGVALLVAAAAVGCSGAVPTPSAPVDASAELIDTLQRTSSEDGRWLHASLLEADPGDVELELRVDTRWAKAFSVHPTVSERCLDRPTPPAWKLLDPMHPDAVTPALADPTTWTEPVKGWLTISVEVPDECEAVADVYLQPRPVSPGESAEPLSLGSLRAAGPEAAQTLATPTVAPTATPEVEESFVAFLTGGPTDSRVSDPLDLRPGAAVRVQWIAEPNPGGRCVLTLWAEADDGSRDLAFARPDIEAADSGRDLLARLTVAAPPLFASGGRYVFEGSGLGCEYWEMTLVDLVPATP